MNITLQDILKKYPHIHIADQSDNQAILHLIDTVSMETKNLPIFYSRGDNFFSLLECGYDSSFVLIMKDENKEVVGVGSFCLNQLYINGKLETAVYLMDARSKRHLPADLRQEWKVLFSELIEKSNHIIDFKFAKYFYCAIIASNQLAINSFVKKKRDFIYHELADYQSINILGKLPFRLWKKKPVSHNLTIGFAQPKDKQELSKFLDRENQLRPFGSCYDLKEINNCLEKRLKQWPHCNLNSFIIAKNPEEKIVGAFLPWSASPKRSLVIKKLNLNLFLLNLVMPMFKGKKAKLNKEFKTLYLTNFEIDSTLSYEIRQNAFTQMLEFLYKQKINQDYHSISLVTYPEDPFVQALTPMGIISVKIPGKIFQVVHQDHLEKNIILPNFKKSPKLEISVG
ncbi:MAG: hypothetical protein A2381_15615 [Bdellovibrionales bacterium RIFOXYB1_FULL_37_110]|nr:MAG: hypothetical protein A2417_07465 [Bdellovibrionales bacterium RIFOXYC1_FULL_37_79]OFZ57049.1 MAG: hypothetical protein A2381_15615 [Bdellovibrionales bacterium RIFOXYB1_FULL_37_110]OFZ64897.1 MAG: hypothetical protein A2577_16985 [Bdellovibrionales bacterium RIFOXYD1_FULL_36_51]